MMDDLVQPEDLLQSADAERSILGGLMLRNDAIDLCGDLTSESFAYPRHQLIFEAIHDLITEGGVADAVTVADRLMMRGRLYEAGGLEYIGPLALGALSAANIRRYVGIVVERAAERLLLTTAEYIRSLALEREGRSLTERHADAVRAVEGVLQPSVSTSRESTAAEALLAALATIDARAERPDGVLGGLSTGLSGLDDLLDGLRPGELIVVGGRPAMGKSCLGEMVARTAAKEGASVRFQSFEMPAADLLLRSASASTSIPLESMRKARLDGEQYDRMAMFTCDSADWPLVIDADSSATVDRIAARARAQKRKRGLGLLVIDHLHLMPRPGRNEVAELGDITASLKRLALELEVPILLLCQLNRGPANAGGRAPTLAELRGSGSIEQDADVVAFVHRSAYYDEQANPGEAEIIVAKHRNGPVGTVAVGWCGECVRFQDNIPDWIPLTRSKNRAFSYVDL